MLNCRHKVVGLGENAFGFGLYLSVGLVSRQATLPVSVVRGFFLFQTKKKCHKPAPSNFVALTSGFSSLQ